MLVSDDAGSTGKLKGEHREPTPASQFWYGLTGNSSNTWFVIAGSFRSKANADEFAAKLKIDNRYDARVYAPLEDYKYYAVVIGSYLSLKEAQALRAQAIHDGLPEDTFVWKYQL